MSKLKTKPCPSRASGFDVEKEVICTSSHLVRFGKGDGLGRKATSPPEKSSSNERPMACREALRPAQQAKTEAGQGLRDTAQVGHSTGEDAAHVGTQHRWDTAGQPDEFHEATVCLLEGVTPPHTLLSP